VLTEDISVAPFYRSCFNRFYAGTFEAFENRFDHEIFNFYFIWGLTVTVRAFH
jgi:hypothetical protein